MSEKQKNLVAQATITVDAPPADVWEALVTPALIKHYMFGTDVVTTWQEGAPIVWQGEWQGQRYEDKGTILQIKPQQMLQYTHYSPLSGQPDEPENYHTVTVELSAEGGQTTVSLAQDKNATETERAHSEENWQKMLEGLKQVVES